MGAEKTAASRGADADGPAELEPATPDAVPAADALAAAPGGSDDPCEHVQPPATRTGTARSRPGMRIAAPGTVAPAYPFRSLRNVVRGTSAARAAALRLPLCA